MYFTNCQRDKFIFFIATARQFYRVQGACEFQLNCNRVCRLRTRTPVSGILLQGSRVWNCKPSHCMCTLQWESQQACLLGAVFKTCHDVRYCLGTGGSSSLSLLLLYLVQRCNNPHKTFFSHYDLTFAQVPHTEIPF